MSTINTRAKVNGFGMYHLAMALLLGALIGVSLTMALFITATSANAEGAITHVVTGPDDTSLVVDSNYVVVSSTLRHCPLEDGHSVHIRRLGPCTWNIGSTTDGNGRGHAFVMYLDTRHQLRAWYVWATSPAVNGWRFLDDSADCVVRSHRFKCANGDRGAYPMVNDGV